MWNAFCSYAIACRDVLDLSKLECWNKWKSWENCARFGGFRVMHEKFCIVSDFPEIYKTIKVNNRHILHCINGPAQRWRDGFEFYYLNGVKVSKEIVMTPAEKLDSTLILKEINTEVRREIVRKIGIERVCDKLNAKCIDKNGNYELLMLDLGDKRTRPYLKMLNPSIGIYHIEGVHPDCDTVEKALNWRNQTEESPILLT
jgi:hypothetical protein